MSGGSSCADFGLSSGGNRDLRFPGPTPGDSLNFTFTLNEDDRVECRTVTIRLRDDNSQSYYVSVEFPEFEFGSPSYNVRPCGDGVTTSQQCNYKTCRNCINPRKRWISVSNSRDVCYRDTRHKCGNAGDEVVGKFVVPLPAVITIVNTDFPDLFGFDEGYFTAVATLVRPPTASPTVSPSLFPTVWQAPSPYPTIRRPEWPENSSSNSPSPTSPPDSSGSSSGTNSAATIAGSVIGALVVVTAASYACFYFWLQRSKSTSTGKPCNGAYGPSFGQGKGQNVDQEEVERLHLPTMVRCQVLTAISSSLRRMSHRTFQRQTP